MKISSTNSLLGIAEKNSAHTVVKGKKDMMFFEKFLRPIIKPWLFSLLFILIIIILNNTEQYFIKFTLLDSKDLFIIGMVILIVNLFLFYYLSLISYKNVQVSNFIKHLNIIINVLIIGFVCYLLSSNLILGYVISEAFYFPIK